MCFFDDRFFPLSTNSFSPFNSQNTFFTREAMKKYLVIPYIGRMDDIWPSYYLQSLGFKVIYNKASVFQDRNVQNLTINMKLEYIGYENTKTMLEELKKDSDNFFKFLPEDALKVFKKYYEFI